MIKIISSTNLRFSLKDNALHSYDDIRSKIRKDKQLWIVFQSTIAMQFKDHCHHYTRITNKHYLNCNDIHKIANDAANAFLHLWTKY